MTEDQWRRTRQILTQAVALRPADCALLLESAFRDEQELKLAVEEVLQQYGAASVRLGVSSADSLDSGRTTAGAEAEWDSPLLEPGETVGRYRVVRLLGTGGQGEVYLAHDEELGTPVALKLMPTRASETDAGPARREAARAAQLRYHPHIATVIDFQMMPLKDWNVAVLAMEYVSGNSAAQIVAEGPVPLKRALDWAIQIARGLEFAHERGIVHCDIKPANVQVERTGAGDRVKVLDFGIARAVFDLTPRGAIAGTLGYMAPEQLTGNKCGPAADIYSLGVTGFELITGERPYAAATLTEVLQHVIAAPVPRASQLARSIPTRLDAALQRAMAKKPEDRFPTVAALRKELEIVRDSISASRWPTVASIAAAAVAAVVLLGFVTSQALDQGLGRATPVRPAIVLDWFVWGVRSLVAPGVVSLILLIAALCVTSACRLVARIGAAQPMCTSIGRRLTNASSRLLSVPTSSLAQTLLLVHVLVLAVLIAWFMPLIDAFMTFMSGGPGSIDALRPSNWGMHQLYGYLMTLELLVFCFAWGGLLAWRARRGERDGGVYIWAGLVAVGLSLLLFTVRFRTISHNESERVLYRSEPCYLIEDRGTSALLFCPRAYPRNVVVNKDRMERTGQIENIFTPLDPS